MIIFSVTVLQMFLIHKNFPLVQCDGAFMCLLCLTRGYGAAAGAGAPKGYGAKPNGDILLICTLHSKT